MPPYGYSDDAPNLVQLWRHHDVLQHLHGGDSAVTDENTCIIDVRQAAGYISNHLWDWLRR